MNYVEKSSQEVNQVYKTYDLSIFKQIKGNRPPNPQHIRRLTSSIKQNGMLQNPILVNEDMEVIDGQHRLMAAQKTDSPIFYLVIKGYKIEEVQILNLNQKNWSSKDFMHGYAKMGVEPYIKLKSFCEINSVFNITDCIALCSNLPSNNYGVSKKFDKRSGNEHNKSEVFEEGTWKGKDFILAQEWADKIKMVKTYYSGYNKSTFVKTIIGLLNKDQFDFNEFLSKLKIQQGKMVDCSNISQCRMLVEEIYNYKRREKVNLRY